MQPATPAPAPPESVLKNASYRAVLLSQLVSNIGDAMHGLAMIWMMNLLTDGSTFYMSMIAVAQIIPRILFAPFTGVLADRWNKVRTMRAVDLSAALLVGAIALLAYQEMLQPWHLLLLGFLLSTVMNFFNPAKSALLVKMVPREQLLQANSISQMVFTITILFGPVLSGILIGAFGPYLCFAIDALTFFLSFLCLAFVRYKEPKAEQVKLDGKQFIRELGEGVQVVKENGLVRSLIPYALFVNFLFAPLNVFMTKLVTDVFQGDARDLSYLESGFGIGMILGSIALGVLSKKLPKNVLFYTGIFGTGAGLFTLAFVPNVWLAVAAVAMIGAFNIMTNVTLQTVILQAIPEERIGRVTGLIGMAAQGAQPLSNFVFGLTMPLLAIPKMLIVLASLCTGANLIMLKPKAVRELR